MKLNRKYGSCLLGAALAISASACSKKKGSESASSASAPQAPTAPANPANPASSVKSDGTTTDANGITHDSADAGKLTAASMGGITSTSNDPTVLALTISLNLVDSADPCATGTVVANKVGFAATEIFAKADIINGAFTLADMPIGADMILHATCSDGSKMVCATKPGDVGGICNKVADAVLSAIEQATGKGLDDVAFKGKPIAQVVSGIVKAATIPSDATDTFKTALTACDGAADKQKCYNDALLASPFAGAYKLVQALATGWTPETIITFVTDTLGLQVQVDNSVYQSIVTVLGDALKTTFVDDVRKLVADVVAAQTNKTSTYAFQLVCQMSINGNPSNFDPKQLKKGDGGFIDLGSDARNSVPQITCDLDQARIILTNMGFAAADITTILTPQQHGGGSSTQYNCTAPNAMNGQCWANPPQMLAVASAQEPNRNDIDGTHNQGGSWVPSLNFISAMDPLMRDLQAAGIDVSGDGPPNLDDAHKKAFTDIMVKDKKYFLGLIGVYFFLNDPEESAIKLSLNDLADVFSGDKFMRERLTGWGMAATGVQTSSGNGNSFVSPLLTYNDTDKGYTYDSVFSWTQPPNGGGNNQQNMTTITADKFQALFTASAPRFNDTFGQYTNVPTAQAITDFIFNASHHEEWNPLGSKFIGVAQYKSSGMPVACKITGNGPNFSLVSGAAITCDTAYTGVSCDSEGKCSFPAGYQYPFLLSQRGWYGDNAGALFSLTSGQDGRPVGANGGTMIKEFKAGNAAGACDASQVGKVIDYTEQMWCGPNVKCTQKMTAYCMDLSALGSPARRRFFPGGKYTVTNTNTQTGETNTWDVPELGVHQNSQSDHNNDYAACLIVPTGTFVDTNAWQATHHVDTTTQVAVSTMDPSGQTTTVQETGLVDLNGVTGAAIADCKATTPTGSTKYILYNWMDFGGSDTMIAFLLDTGNNSNLNFNGGNVTDNHWERNNVKITEAQILNLLGASYSVAGSAATQINGMNYVNPQWDPKFDPYCDATHGDACACYAVKTVSSDRKTFTYEDTLRTDSSQCGLLDKAADATLSQPPFCMQCQGSDAAVTFFANYGGKSGAALAGASQYITDHMIPMDSRSALVCKFKFSGESVFRNPTTMNYGDWTQDGTGCPATDGATRVGGNSDHGPLRLINPKPMRNSYNIGRPQTLLKLINYAFKSVGTGHAIGAADKLFSPDEAASLLMLQQKMPISTKVYTPAGAIDPSFSAYWQSINDPSGNGSGDAVSSLIKGTLKAGGILSQDDLDFSMPHNNGH